MNHRPVCAKCEVELRTETNGITVAELCQNDTELYKIWNADLWKCPCCGYEIVIGFANNPTWLQGRDDREAGDLLIANAEEFGQRVIYDKEKPGKE